LNQPGIRSNRLLTDSTKIAEEPLISLGKGRIQPPHLPRGILIILPVSLFERFPQGRRENVARLRIQMAAKGVNGYEIEGRRLILAPPLNLPDVFLTTETISARPSL